MSKGRAKTNEFNDFVDQQNAIAAYRHAMRGLGLDGNLSSEDEVLREQMAALVGEEICQMAQKALDGQYKEGEAPLDFRALIGSKIVDLLDKFVADEVKGPISMLDVITLGLTDYADIKKFLKRHGSDLDNPRDLQYVSEVLREAIAFFDQVIADEPKHKINPTLKNIGNTHGISHVFQTAAGKHDRKLIPQACGLLRVAAAIDFLNRDPLLSLLPQAEAAIKEIHRKYFTSAKGKPRFDSHKPGEIPIELVRCQLRSKERNRMIAKLLHKPQNNTKEVVDHVGMRVITKSAFDALRFLYYAFFKPDTAIFPGMTIRTDETKQLLFSESKLMEALQNSRKARKLVKELATPTDDNDDLIHDEDEKLEGANRFSAKQYKALQITFDLPLTDEHGNRRSFPIEVQIVDQASNDTNETAAPHYEYKERQTKAVKGRLLGNNLDTRYRSHQKQGH